MAGKKSKGEGSSILTTLLIAFFVLLVGLAALAFMFGPETAVFACDTFAGNQYDHCVQKVAIFLSDVPMCDQIKGTKFIPAPFKVRDPKTQQLTEIKLTEPIENPPKMECISQIAANKNDPYLCKGVEGVAVAKTTIDCLYGVAIKNNNPAACAMIGDATQSRMGRQMNMKDCFSRVGPLPAGVTVKPITGLDQETTTPKPEPTPPKQEAVPEKPTIPKTEEGKPLEGHSCPVNGQVWSAEEGKCVCYPDRPYVSSATARKCVTSEVFLNEAESQIECMTSHLPPDLVAQCQQKVAGTVQECELIDDRFRDARAACIARTAESTSACLLIPADPAAPYNQERINCLQERKKSMNDCNLIYNAYTPAERKGRVPDEVYYCITELARSDKISKNQCDNLDLEISPTIKTLCENAFLPTT